MLRQSLCFILLIAVSSADEGSTPEPGPSPLEEPSQATTDSSTAKVQTEPNMATTATTAAETNLPSETEPAQEPIQSEKPVVQPSPGAKWTEQGVSIEVTKQPDDPECLKSHKRDTLHQFYTMSLKDGKVIDSNVGKKPQIFRLGVGGVIKGLDIAMEGMCEGEERKAVIPPEMGFKGGASHVPPGSTLVFEVKLEKIVPFHHRWTEQDIEIEVIKDIPESECLHARPGDNIHMTFTVTANKDEEKDLDKEGIPSIFRLGRNHVVVGLDIGMLGMCQGERRKLTIPAHWGYGEKGVPAADIPPDATLYYEVLVTKVVQKHEEL